MYITDKFHQSLSNWNFSPVAQWLGVEGVSNLFDVVVIDFDDEVDACRTAEEPFHREGVFRTGFGVVDWKNWVKQALWMSLG